ncbi:hypothetical protein ISF_05655 [Cordyceps fumosorosea ARSEF 2679]|uniref:glucan endo-1,3-beta-D-glucosidase n=1 Tax=Cordyceps fumosorosea (strain ARSEF 2679) TaxID=1081104 RepID=A0A167UH97_CORFA|nr:hypothetical protein ISF_05655 [Cordyceps fumosorosea ARSEF 2679]OAA61576.1 hypothetical protein ISF_05655 [Cordyceps fumosorosea ARSEF 2679]
MRHVAIPLAATGLATLVAGLTQQCSGTASNEGGNFFCGAVDQILYQGIGKPGTYQAVTGMTSSGELPPFDEGLSVHFRGPLQLKEFAVYTPSKKAKREPTPQQQRREQSAGAHGHGHQRFHEARKEKRADWVTATIDGKIVSWENNWFGGGTPATSTPKPVPAAAAPTPPPANSKAAAAPPALPKSKPPTGGGSSPSGKDWDRTSYYSAESQQADNLVFLGNYGGAGSGTFDTTWGNSLAFLNAQGNGGASSSQVLADGFEGANKIFLFHFKMPLDGDRGFNGDMPAIWALNARVPRTAQYNKCSCWPACGEFDFFEVLARGDDKCKSTVHLAAGAGAGGSSDYFRRPTDAFVKGAVVFSAESGVSVRLLPKGTDFAKGLDAKAVEGWLAAAPQKDGGVAGKIVSSVFQVAGGLLG